MSKLVLTGVYLFGLLVGLSGCVTPEQYCAQYFDWGTREHYHCVQDRNQRIADGFRRGGPYLFPQQQQRERKTTCTRISPSQVECVEGH